MIALYYRLIRNSKTINQLNMVKIALENRMTPLELETLKTELSSKRPSKGQVLFNKCIKELSRSFPVAFKTLQQNVNTSMAAINMVDKLDIMYKQIGKPRPEPFTRHSLSRNIKLYATEGEKSYKTLAICFTGNAERMMMPTPIFLQHIDAERIDVALIRNAKRNGFRKGIEGITKNLESSIDKLKDLLKIGKYRTVVALGTSGGGLPAVLTATRLGLDAVLSVGGNNPNDPHWQIEDNRTACDLLRNYTNCASKTPKTFLAFGVDFPKDKLSAESLAEFIPAQLLPITDPCGQVRHNALFPLIKQGKLTELLETTIFDSSYLKKNGN